MFRKLKDLKDVIARGITRKDEGPAEQQHVDESKFYVDNSKGHLLDETTRYKLHVHWQTVCAAHGSLLNDFTGKAESALDGSIDGSELDAGSLSHSFSQYATTVTAMFHSHRVGRREIDASQEVPNWVLQANLSTYWRIDEFRRTDHPAGLSTALSSSLANISVSLMLKSPSGLAKILELLPRHLDLAELMARSHHEALVELEKSDVLGHLTSIALVVLEIAKSDTSEDADVREMIPGGDVKIYELLQRIQSLVKVLFALETGVTWYTSKTCQPSLNYNLELGVFGSLLSKKDVDSPVLHVLNAWLRTGIGRAADACKSEAILQCLFNIIQQSEDQQVLDVVVQSIAILLIANVRTPKSDSDGDQPMAVMMTANFLQKHVVALPDKCRMLLSAVRQAFSACGSSFEGDQNSNLGPLGFEWLLSLLTTMKDFIASLRATENLQKNKLKESKTTILEDQLKEKEMELDFVTKSKERNRTRELLSEIETLESSIAVEKSQVNSNADIDDTAGHPLSGRIALLQEAVEGILQTFLVLSIIDRNADSKIEACSFKSLPNKGYLAFMHLVWDLYFENSTKAVSLIHSMIMGDPSGAATLKTKSINQMELNVGKINSVAAFKSALKLVHQITPADAASGESTRHSLMDILLTIVSSKRSNLALCCEHEVALDILELFSAWGAPTDRDEKLLLDLLVMIISYDSSATAVRQFLCCLYRDNFLPVAQRLKLQNALVSMTLSKSRDARPPSIMYISGPGSHLELPPIGATLTGYGLHVWMFIESLNTYSTSSSKIRNGVRSSDSLQWVQADPSKVHSTLQDENWKSYGKSSIVPRLAAMSNQKGFGIEVVLNDGVVQLMLSYGQDSQTRIINTGVLLPTKKWLLISVVHSAQRSTSLISPEIKLLVNGRVHFKTTAKAHVTRDTFNRNWIGHNYSLKQDSSPRHLEAAAKFAMDVQVVSCIVTHAISEEAVQQLFSFGRDYIGVFNKQPHKRSRPQGPPRSPQSGRSKSGSSAEDAEISELSSKMVLFVHAKAMHAAKGSLHNLVDHLSQHNSKSSGRGIHVLTFQHRSLFDIIQAEGGSRVGLLCLDNIDSLVEKLLSSRSDSEVQNVAQLPPGLRRFAQQATNAGLALFRTFLAQTPGKEILPRSYQMSIAMAAALLRSSRHKLMSTEAVGTIESMLKQCGNDWSSQKVVLDSFVFDPALWSDAPQDVLLEHFRLMRWVVRRKPLLCWKRYSVHLCLEQLALCARFADDQNECVNVLLEILDTYLVELDVGYSFIKQVFSWIRTADAEFVSINVCQWILRLMNDAFARMHQSNTNMKQMRASLKLMKCLFDEGPPLEIFTCLERPSESIRTIILHCIVYLCRADSPFGTEAERSAMQVFAYNGVAELFLQNPTALNVELIDAMVAISISSAVEPESIEHIGLPRCNHIPKNKRSAFAGGPHVSSAEPTVITSHPAFLPKKDSQAQSGDKDAAPKVTNPSVLLAMLNLLANVESVESTNAQSVQRNFQGLRLYALKRLKGLFDSVSNIADLTEIPSWQRTFALLLVEYNKTVPSVGTSDREPFGDNDFITEKQLKPRFAPEASLAIDLLVTLLFLRTQDTTNSSNELELTLAYIDRQDVKYETPQLPNDKCTDSDTETTDVSAWTPHGIYLQSWILALLLEKCTKWLAVSSGQLDTNSATPAMLRAVFIAERVLYLRTWPNTASHEAYAISRCVLACAVLGFTRAADVEFDTSLTYNDIDLTLQSSDSDLGSDGGGNPEFVRSGGFLRFTLRLAMEELCNIKQDPLSSALSAKATQVAVDWLNRFRIAGQIETNLTSDTAVYIIGHLSQKLNAVCLQLITSDDKNGEKSREDIVAAVTAFVMQPEIAERSEQAVLVFRRFLKWWWWCFDESTSQTDDRVAISGPEDPRLAPEEDFQVTLALVVSPWWASIYSSKILPVLESHVEQNHIERDAGVDLLKRRLDVCIDEWISSSDMKAAAADQSARQNIQRLIEPMIISDKDVHKRSQQLLRKFDKTFMQSLTSWKDAHQFLYSARGILGPSNPERMPDGLVGSTPGEWRVDSHEDFSRIRRKLAPVKTGFDKHQAASEARERAATRKRGEDNKPDDTHIAAEFRAVPGDLDGIVHHSGAGMVKYMTTVPGTFAVTKSHVHFISDPEYHGSVHSSEYLTKIMGSTTDFEIELPRLREMHIRRFNLRPVALELFLVDQTNYMVKFDNQEDRDSAFNAIKSLEPPNLIYAEIRGGSQLLRRSGLTKRWQQRAISNFEYLMQLNSLAGRTYNDLNQYPVFPWVLNDMSSENLDLSSPASFRDLTKPVGALNPDRAEMLTMMYEQNDDPVMGRFHYGTHYSNAATVLHYLIRLEPYTTLHIDLQAGRFDHADRLFFSLPQTWSGISEGSSDVKELIPELFFLPEALQNTSKFDLGHMQNGKAVNNVELPAWAKNPRDFIKKHREALESEFVSANLHHWIDLIFGYKQRGPAAEKAVNCFLRSSYEGVVDLEAIEDPQERKAMEDMVRELGQTPSQLLTQPHPSRNDTKRGLGKRGGGPDPEEAEHISSGVAGDNATKTIGVATPLMQANWRLNKAYFADLKMKGSAGVAVILPPFIDTTLSGWMRSGMTNALVTVSDDGFWAVHNWLPNTSSHGRPFTLDTDCAYQTKMGIFTNGFIHNGKPPSSRSIVSVPDNSIALITGSLDNTVKIVEVSSTLPTRIRLASSSIALLDVSSCVALSSDGRSVAVGYRDGICAIYDLLTHSPASATKADRHGSDGSGRNLKPHLDGPKTLIYGHREEVACIVISTELDMIVAGSLSGYINVYTASTGDLRYTLCPNSGTEGDEPTWSSIEHLVLAPSGTFVAHVVWNFRGSKKRNHALYCYSVNCSLMATDFSCGNIVDMVIDAGSNRLITCKKKGVVSVRDADTLEVQQVMSTNNNNIRSVAITNDGTRLLLGLEDGKLVIIAAETDGHESSA